MARLSQMIPGFAAALQVPEKSVKNAAVVLRGARLLTTGPRGRGAPHMTPKDATNLLLALMYDDDHEAAATNVPLLYDMPLTSYGSQLSDGTPAKRGKRCPDGKITPPPHAILSDDETSRSLGAVVEAIFTRLMRSPRLHGTGELSHGVESTIVDHLLLQISRPGHEARIVIDSPGVTWTLAYVRQNDTSYDPAATFLRSSRSLDVEELRALATVLTQGLDAAVEMTLAA